MLTDISNACMVGGSGQGWSYEEFVPLINEVLNLCISPCILQLNNTDSGIIITPLATQGSLTEWTSCS